MRVFAATLMSILCVGCAITREQAVAAATRAIVKATLPLPAHYTVSVIEGYSKPEPLSYRLWGVEFRVPGRTEPLYTVWVQQSSGRVEGVTDYVLEEPASVHGR
jgi:hypothetical protein